MSRGKNLYSVCLHGHKSGAPQTSGPDFNTQSREKETQLVGRGYLCKKTSNKIQHRHFPAGNCVHTFQNVHFIMWIKNNSNISKNPRTPPSQIQGRYKPCHTEQWHKITPESLFLHWAPQSRADPHHHFSNRRHRIFLSPSLPPSTPLST